MNPGQRVTWTGSVNGEPVTVHGEVVRTDSQAEDQVVVCRADEDGGLSGFLNGAGLTKV